MLLLAPALDAAVRSGNLDLADIHILRRYFRALIHLALAKPLDAGVSPHLLRAQVFEVFDHELQEREARFLSGHSDHVVAELDKP
jgi:hypothetical protein